MERPFNLLTSPWIPVRTSSGRNAHLGLIDLFARSDQIEDLIEESRVRHALYLLLIAIGWEAAKGWEARRTELSKDQLAAWAADPETLKHFSSHLTFLADDLDAIIAKHGFAPETKGFVPLEECWIDRFPCGSESMIYDANRLGSQAVHFRQRLALLSWMPGHSGRNKAPRASQVINVLLCGATLLDTIQIAVGQLIAKARNNKPKFVETIMGRAGWIRPAARNSTLIGRLTAQPILLQPCIDGWHFIHLKNGPVKTALYKPWDGADRSQVFTDFDQRSEVDDKRSKPLSWKHDSIGWDFISALLADESLASERVTSIRIVTTVCNTANTREVIEAEYPRQEFFIDSVVIQETAVKVKALADTIRKKAKHQTPDDKRESESAARVGRKRAASNQLLYEARTDYRSLLEPDAAKRQTALYRTAKRALDTHCPSTTVTDAKDYSRLLKEFRRMIYDNDK
jgi:CRISPR-associated protein Cse1 family